MHFEQGHDAPRAVRYLLHGGRERPASVGPSRGRQHWRGGGCQRSPRSLPSRERDRQELSLRMILGVSVDVAQGIRRRRGEGDLRARARRCAGADGSRDAFMAQWLLGLFYYFRAEMRLLPRDRRASSSIAPDGWPIRCSPAKRRVHSASRSWTWAGSRWRWISATRSPCSVRNAAAIVRRGRLPDRIPRSRASATRPGPCGRSGIPIEPWSASAARGRWPIRSRQPRPR